MVGALHLVMSGLKMMAVRLLLVLFTLFLSAIGSQLGSALPTVATPPQSMEKITSVPTTEGNYSLTNVIIRFITYAL